MRKFYESLVRRKVAIPVFFLAVTAICAALLPLVTVNYDLTEYLPADAGTSRAIEVAKAEFDYPGTAVVMAGQITVAEARTLKERIAAVPGVKGVLWLDDAADVTQPLPNIAKELLDTYYKDGYALFDVEFEQGDYEKKTTDAVTAIKNLDGRLVVAGNAENSLYMKSVLNKEMFSIIVIVVPICLIILAQSSCTWLEPALYHGVIGVSIAINMGTNAFLGSVSFITHSMAAVLQLAVSMDYSIFLMHRYFEERDGGADVRQAVVNASVHSLSSIAASAMTTVAGFAALLFMRYGIGADIGLVLLKGILFSFLTVMVLMPVLMLLLNKPLERARHRSLMPSFAAIGRGTMKLRWGFIAVAAVLVVPALMAQSRNAFLYGDNSASAGTGEAYAARMEIIERFGVRNAVMVLVPSGDTAGEAALASELETLPHVRRLTALSTIADSAVARDFLPRSLTERFTNERFSRMIVYIDVDGEQPAAFEAAQAIRETAERHYPGRWLAAGQATSFTDIRDTVKEDTKVVTAVSLIAVGLIVLITFRSATIPLILLLSIQSAVWINMAVPYFAGQSIIYIGYLIISSLQLGCTIDYGILLTNRYREYRILYGPREAAVSALKAAGPSIVTSALILATAGFGFGMVSQLDSISQLGHLLGRGALISGLMTLLLLPSLLATLDGVVRRTTIRRKGEPL